MSDEIIGLIPAGGRARRIAPLPCSKEIYPVLPREADSEERPKVVGQYLIERMRSAGVRRIYIILRKGKWDIPSYFGDGARLGVRIAYLIARHPFGPPYTLDQAFPFVARSLVMFGFPDIIFYPADAYKSLLAHQANAGAEIVLGLFPAPAGRCLDKIETEVDGRVRCVERHTRSGHTWTIAVWTPAFNRFLHERLREDLKRRRNSSGSSKSAELGELTVGDVIAEAVRAGLRVHGVRLSGASYLDIGTPEDLRRAPSYVARMEGMARDRTTSE